MFIFRHTFIETPGCKALSTNNISTRQIFLKFLLQSDNELLLPEMQKNWDHRLRFRDREKAGAHNSAWSTGPGFIAKNIEGEFPRALFPLFSNEQSREEGLCPKRLCCLMFAYFCTISNLYFLSHALMHDVACEFACAVRMLGNNQCERPNIDSYLGYSAGLIWEISHTRYIERYPKVKEANPFLCSPLKRFLYFLHSDRAQTNMPSKGSDISLVARAYAALSVFDRNSKFCNQNRIQRKS